MPDAIILTITQDNISPFVLTAPTSPTVNIQLGPSLTGAVDLTGPAGSPSPKFMNAFVSGSPLDGEIVAATDAPYDFSVTLANCEATAITTSAAEAIFTINVEGLEVGTITFEPGVSEGTFNFTGSTDISKGDLVSITAPATSDTNLANISFLLA